MSQSRDDGIMRLHQALTEIGSNPVPDPEWSWARMSAALPDRRGGLVGRVRAWLRRPLILSFASLVMGTGGAYAAGFEPARNGVDWVLNQLPGVSIDDDRVSEENDEASGNEATHDSEPDGTDGDRSGSAAGSADDERDSDNSGDRNSGDGDDRDGGDRDGDDRDGDDADDGGDRDGDDRDGDDADDGDDRDDHDTDDEDSSGSGSSGSGSSGSGSDDADADDLDDDRDSDDGVELPDADELEDEDD